MLKTTFPFIFMHQMQRNATVAHSTVTKIIEVSKFGFVCFSIQILTLVSLQDYLWVLETFLQWFLWHLVDSHSHLLQQSSDQCSRGETHELQGGQKGEMKTSCHLVTSNFTWSKIAFVSFFLCSFPLFQCQNSHLKKFLVLKCKVMNTMCFYESFDLNSFLKIL